MIATSGRVIGTRRGIARGLGVGVAAAATGCVVAGTEPEFVLGVAVLSVAGCSAIVSPANGLRLLMMAAMLGGLSTDTPIGNLRLDQALVLPVFLGVSARRLADRHMRISGPGITPLVLLAAAYLALNLISSLVGAPDPPSSLRVVAWLGLSAVAMLVAALAVPAYMDGRRALIEWTMVGAGAALLGAATYFLGVMGVSTFGTQVDSVSGALATKGTFLEANLFGSFCAAISVLAVGFAVFDDGLSRRMRLLMISSAVVSAVACLGSLTRAAWLGLAVGLAVEAAIGLRSFRRAKLVVRGITASVVTVVIAAFLGLAPTLLDRSTSLLSDSSGTVAFRVERYQLAFNEWLQAPLIGLGTNSFGQRHLDPTQGFLPDYLAGLGIATLYDAGMLGLLCLTSLFLLVGARLLRSLSARSGPRVRVAALAGFGALASMLVSYQATNAFWFSYNWILIGILAALPRTKLDPSVPAERPQVARIPG